MSDTPLNTDGQAGANTPSDDDADGAPAQQGGDRQPAQTGPKPATGGEGAAGAGGPAGFGTGT